MIPGLLGLMGSSSAGLAVAPALQVLTWPLLALTGLTLGRGWYVELSQGKGWRSPWSRRSTAILFISTATSLVVWGLRFGGLLGGSPF
ncbi:MAG: hypothetical protein FI703_01620 [SAR202 cluster bacterium]|nr:hypothetical protein [SAR202 cluster bacterium]